MTEATRPRTRSRLAAALALLALLAVIALAWLARSRPWEDPDAVWRRAQAALRAEQIDRAESELSRLSRLRAPNAPDWMLRAQVASARGRPDEALEALKQIPDDDPLGAQARLLAGRIELRRDRARSAEAYLLHAARLEPKLAPAHSELIYIYGVQLRRRLLNEQFRILSDLTSLTFKNVWHWCLVRNTVWEPREDAEIMGRFLKADPSDRASRLALAENLRQLGRREEAEKTLSSLSPDDVEARAIRVRLALDRGDERGAEALLAGGPAGDPGLSQLRGRFALAHGDGPAAVRHFRIAVAADPDDRDAVTGLASALLMAGDAKGAAPFLERAKRFNRLDTLMQRASLAGAENDAKLLRQLGDACEAVGRLPEAKAWFRLAIALDPLDPEAQHALFRLDHPQTPPPQPPSHVAPPGPSG